MGVWGQYGAKLHVGGETRRRRGFNDLLHDPMHTLYIHDVTRLAPVRACLKGQTIYTGFVDVSVCQLLP